jgi:hypothetical protein
MKNRNLLLLALVLLILPATTRASTYAGPPNTFIGIAVSATYGYIKVDLGKEGKFTGVLDLTGKPHSTIKGTLDETGSFSGITAKGATPYTLLVTGSTPGTYMLTGSAGGSLLEGFPLAYSKGQTATEEGRYNTAVFSTGTGNIPPGYGWSVLTVGKTGAGRISGKLPDGTGFSASGEMLADGTTAHVLVMDDKNIYNKAGDLLAITEFQSAESGTTTGVFLWQKPMTKGPYYPAAFSTEMEASGIVYFKAKGDPLTSGTIIFKSAVMVTGTQAFTVSSKGVVTVDSPNPSNVKLSISPSTGAVRGSFDFPHMVAGKTINSVVKYSGVLLQDGTTGVAVGYFLPPIISGSAVGGSWEIGVD